MQPGLLTSRAVRLKTRAADRFRHERFRIGTHLISIRQYGGFRRGPLAAARFVLFDRELFNHTYDIENPAMVGCVGKAEEAPVPRCGDRIDHRSRALKR